MRVPFFCENSGILASRPPLEQPDKKRAFTDSIIFPSLGDIKNKMEKKHIELHTISEKHQVLWSENC